MSKLNVYFDVFCVFAGIILEHLGFYYNRYFGKSLSAKSYGLESDLGELVALAKDCVFLNKDKAQKKINMFLENVGFFWDLRWLNMYVLFFFPGSLNRTSGSFANIFCSGARVSSGRRDWVSSGRVYPQKITESRKPSGQPDMIKNGLHVNGIFLEFHDFSIAHLNHPN